jgi:hypothetical protein
MSDESDRLKARVAELEDAIRRVVTQEFDDLCWLDVYRDLSALVGVEFDLKRLSTEEFLGNCARYERSLRTGEPYRVSAVE